MDGECRPVWINFLVQTYNRVIKRASLRFIPFDLFRSLFQLSILLAYKYFKWFLVISTFKQYTDSGYPSVKLLLKWFCFYVGVEIQTSLFLGWSYNALTIWAMFWFAFLKWLHLKVKTTSIFSTLWLHLNS